MAKPSDIPEEVSSVVHETIEETGTVAQFGSARKDQERARRVEAMRLRVAGLTYEQIAERLKISPSGAYDMVARTLSRAENKQVEVQRALENERLDVAQTVIWQRLMQGDYKALDAYLRIHDRRVKINGLAAPTKLDISMSVRHEMEEALANLERLVTSSIVDAEVVEGSETETFEAEYDTDTDIGTDADTDANTDYRRPA